MPDEGEIIRENRKYRILLFSLPPGQLHSFSLSSGSNRIELGIKESVVKLQRRFWAFGWFWRTIGTTNLYSVGEQWIETYFKRRGPNGI